MNLTTLRQREGLEQFKKLVETYQQLQRLCDAISEKKLDETVIQKINVELDALNAIETVDDTFRKSIKKAEDKILKILEKDLKIVPINYYKTLWMILGMSAFGMPFGVLYGVIIGNMGMIGLGLPFGMAIGVFLGMNLDKKALAQGKQLAFERKM
jgi:LPS O-antigen subunit length determinant protein (WzzB/FepE family)